jgi:hypothetical protein
MDLGAEDKKRAENQDDNLWYHNTPYKFRRMQWASPYPQEREDPTYGQNLQGPLLPPPQLPVPDLQEGQKPDAMEVDTNK